MNHNFINLMKSILNDPLKDVTNMMNSTNDKVRGLTIV